MFQAMKQDIYIINDFDIAKELFSKDIFCHRLAPWFVKNHRFFQKGQESGIAFNNGHSWSLQRRFSLRTLRDFGFGKQAMEETMNLEIDDLIEKFSSGGSDDILIGSDFNLPVINILWQMVASSKISDPLGEKMVELVTKMFILPENSRNLPAFILKLFPERTGYSTRASIIEDHKKYLMETITEHEKTFEQGHFRDFIDVYLAQMQEDKSGDFTKEQLAVILLDFFYAGTETSSTTMKWFVLFMTVHQDWQEKCRKEMSQVLGSNRPQLSDMTQLHTLMATIAEVQRLALVAGMTLPHHLAADFTYRGHTYRKNTFFVANIGFIMRDPAHFTEPEKFNPGRFLDAEGRFVKNERIVPFGIGKRFCMGELLARNEIFLFAANLLQKLRFLAPDTHPSPNPSNYTSNRTKIPDHYYVKIQQTDCDF
eukprot:TRINITY_DN15486_c0_g1_i3.p1 TRINITY_DN15486_c0_g1~~TRINITY_DN15486_c0_g1_i3.p1  ORF type:complete len:479 (+),score=77.85 TRINITY_DN15486_c0_g1_i3:163-1437(+)